MPGGQPDAEVGLLAAERAAADPAEVGPEAAGGQRLGPPEGHVGADEVADRGRPDRQAPVGAADHPVELGREPVGAAGPPPRPDEAADAEHVRVPVAREQVPGPVGVGGGVVVEEGDQGAPGLGQGGVAGAGKAAPLPVGEDPQAGQVLPGEAEEFGAVVDDQQQFPGRAALGVDRRDGGAQVVPALDGVGADHHREVRCGAVGGAAVGGTAVGGAGPLPQVDPVRGHAGSPPSVSSVPVRSVPVRAVPVGSVVRSQPRSTSSRPAASTYSAISQATPTPVSP